MALSEATVDWASLTMNGINITAVSEFSQSRASAGNDISDLNQQTVFMTHGFSMIETEVLGATGKASTSDEFLSAVASAEANGTSPTRMTNATSLAQRGRFFEPNETGNLSVEVDVELSQELTTQFSGETASAVTLARLLFFAQDPPTLPDLIASDEAALTNLVADGNSFSESMNETLSFTLPLGPNSFPLGQNIGIVVESQVEAFSPIPVPSTILLLGSGLVGIGLFRLRTPVE